MQFALKAFKVIVFVFLALCFQTPFNTFASKLPLRYFASADGMASSYIAYITRDSLGFLWFCTRDGLIRFDGSEFTNYRLRDEQTAQTLYYLKETSGGVYWIAGSDGLYRLRRGETNGSNPIEKNQTDNTRQILNAEKISDISFRTVYEDRAGRIWGGANGLFLISEANGETRLQKIELGATADTIRGINVRDILETADGSLWLACYIGLIRKLPDERIVYYPIARNSDYDETFALKEDADGRIIVGHATGLFVLKPESLNDLTNAENFSSRSLNLKKTNFNFSANVPLPQNSNEIIQINFPKSLRDSGAKQANIYALFRDAKDDLWFPANNLLYFWSGGKIRQITAEDDDLPSIGSLADDSSGNLWIGTSSGAIKYVREGFTTFNRRDGLESDAVFSLQESADGELFAVLNDWTIARFDGGKFVSTKLKIPSSVRSIWGTTMAQIDDGGAWWALTSDGLYRFTAPQNSPSEIFNESSGLKSGSLFCSFKDSRGNLWFSTRRLPNDNGLTKIDARSGEPYTFTTAENYPAGKSAASFAEDRDGNLWLGFYESGIARLRNGRFDFFSNDAGVPNGAIFALHFDAQNRLWIASSREGLGRVDNPRDTKLSFQRLTIEQGLSSNSVRSLTEDANGNIYIGTARGVDRFNPETNVIRHFSTADGLAGDNVTAALRDRNGWLWFGTPNGISRFIIEDDAPQPAPRVFITNLNIAGTRYEVSIFGQREIDNIKVGANENNLQINFSGIGDADTLHYQYRLAGASDDWSNQTFERAVNFANLAPGAYQFQVRSINNKGQTSENPASVSFVITPPFYRTWWFLSFAALLAFGAVFWLDRYRVGKTRQIKAALTATKASETRFRTLTQTASDAIITIDETSRIIYANEAVEKIFGYAVDEVIGEKLTVLMPEDLQPLHDAGLNRYLRESRKHISWSAIELPGRHKSGAEIPLELSFGEFEQNEKRYFTGVIRDVSERRRAEEALRKSREERLKELERVRSRIARDLHDDVGSSLTQIALYSEVARQKRNGDEANEPLELIAAVSNELVDSMSDIVWAINPQKDYLHDLVQRMRRFASEILSAADIDLQFTAPALETDATLGANLRREVFLIFKETVNNIAKHSRARNAEIDFRLLDDSLFLQIKDDGRGFDVEKNSAKQEFDWRDIKGGNGLTSMSRRAAELGGTYRVESKTNRGTVVSLFVPLGKNTTENGAADIHLTV